MSGRIGRAKRSMGSLSKRHSQCSFVRARKNPYAKRLKKQVTIRLGVDVLEYFKALAKETGIPYQNLINLYLRDCVVSGKKPMLKWATSNN